MKREILPLNVDDRIGVDCQWGNVHNGRRNLKEGGNYEDSSKERVTMSLAE